MKVRLPHGLRWKLPVALAALAILALVFGRGWVKTVYRGDGKRFTGDAVRLRSVTWTPPSALAVDAAAVEPFRGGHTLLSSQPSSRGDLDIFVRFEVAAGWSTPLPFTEAQVNSPSVETSPAFAAAAMLLIFASDRDGGFGGLDLWACRRTQEGWETPYNLGPRVNSPYSERDAALSLDGELLVFATDRPEALLFAAPADWRDADVASRPARDFNLAVSWRQSTAAGGRIWSIVRPLDAMNSAANERAAVLTPAGDFVYFASDRKGGHGGLDLYRSRRRQVPPHTAPSGEGLAVSWERPENLGAPPSSTLDETPLALTDGGFSLVIEARARGRSESVLALSRSLEVESEVEVGSVPLAVFLQSLRRLVMLLASAAAVALVVLVLVRTRRSWAESLVGRSAIAAILVHALMIHGFYFWKVGTDIVAVAREAEARHAEPAIEAPLESVLAARIALEVNQPGIESAAPELPAIPRLEHTSVADAASGLQDPDRAAAPRLSADTPAEREPVELVLAPTLSSALREAVDRAIEPPATISPPPRATAAPAALPSSPALPAEPAESERDPVATTERVPSLLVLPQAADLPRAPPLTAETPAGRSSAPLVPPRPAASPLISEMPSPLLAAAARIETPREHTRESLPVPEQSPDQSPYPLPAPPAPEPSPEAERAELSAASPPRPPLEAVPAMLTTRVPAALGPRDVPPAGIRLRIDLTESEGRVDAFGFPVPARHTRQSRMPLEEPAPVAAAAADAAGSTDGALIGPRPEERQETRVPPAPAEIRSLAIVVARQAPSVPSDAVLHTSRPALARLDPTPSPGALLRAAAVPSGGLTTAASSAPREALPEESAVAVADVVPVSADMAAAGEFSARASTAAAAPSLAAIATTLAVAPAPADPLLPQLAPAAPPASPRAAIDRDSEAIAEHAAVVDLAAALGLPSRSRSPPPLPESALPESETPSVPDLREVRSPPSRAKLVKELGGTEASESAVRLALEWFARHQSADGRWDVDGFDAGCGKCGSPGFHVRCDVAITAMAILAFLGYDHTPDGSTAYAGNVRRALEWMIAQQAADGNLAGEDRQYTMYSHGIATLALSEAHLMTRDRSYLPPLRRACDLIVRAQDPRSGGWRYLPVPPERGDTSITGWQVMALLSARGGGVFVPEPTLERARHWFDVEAGGGEAGGLFGYMSKHPPQIAMVAEGLFASQVLGRGRGDARIDEAARYLHTEMRDGRHLDNFYLLYYGTLALYQYQGWIWEAWNREVRDFLLAKQRRLGTRAGSWDPRDKWSEGGGRLLATAFAALSLEVYYRYLPLYWSRRDVR